MKRIAMLLCAAALLMGQKGFANDCSEPCFNWCTDISYSVYADYLFWKATREGNFIASQPIGGGQNLTYITPSYQSGYRVGAALLYSCISFDARYTSFRPNDRKNLAFPVADGFFPGTTPWLSYNLNYQVVDLALGYTQHFQCHRGYVKPYVGAKLAWLKEISTFAPGVAIAGAIGIGRTHAYGPMIGIEGSWELFQCWVPISLIARGDISLLSSKTTPSYNGIPALNGIQPLFYAATSEFAFITVPDIFLGLAFDFCNCWCVDANIQVGYEAQVWNGIRRYEGSTSNFDIGTQNSGVIGLGGLVVRAGLTY